MVSAVGFERMSTQADFKARDAGSYDDVAGSFDRFTRRFTEPIANEMVSLLELRGRGPAPTLLDIGTGTGVVALAAARAAARVTAVDLSDGMLAAAKENAEAAGLAERIVFQKEDAEALSLADASFQCVTSLYALFHFPNPVQAIREMHRVLAPNGTLVLAVGSGPPLLSRLGPGYALKRLPLVVQLKRGRWLSAPQLIDGLLDEFLPAREPEESHMAAHRHHGASARELPSMLQAAGFTDIRCSAEAHLAMVENTDEYFELQATFSSKARKRLMDADPGAAQRLRDAFDRRCREVLSAGGRLTYPYAAFIAVATRR